MSWFKCGSLTLVTQELRSPLSEAWDRRSTSETGEASGDGSEPVGAELLALSMMRRNGPPDGTSGGSSAVAAVVRSLVASAASCLCR
jgi:hypothetical protein